MNKLTLFLGCTAKCISAQSRWTGRRITVLVHRPGPCRQSWHGLHLSIQSQPPESGSKRKKKENKQTKKPKKFKKKLKKSQAPKCQWPCLKILSQLTQKLEFTQRKETRMEQALDNTMRNHWGSPWKSGHDAGHVKEVFKPPCKGISLLCIQKGNLRPVGTSNRAIN